MGRESEDDMAELEWRMAIFAAKQCRIFCREFTGKWDSREKVQARWSARRESRVLRDAIDELEHRIETIDESMELTLSGPMTVEQIMAAVEGMKKKTGGRL